MPISWFSFNRIEDVDGNGTARAFITNKIAAGPVVISNKPSSQLVISNSIDGLMLKTADLNKPQTLKDNFAICLNTDVTYSMTGPMVNKFTFKKVKCGAAAKLLENYLSFSPNAGGGDPIKLNISTFLNDTSGSCDFFLRVIIYNSPQEEFTIGQYIFNNYNVTWDHDNNTIGFIQQLIIPEDEPYTWAVITFGCVLGGFIILSLFGVYWSIFRKGSISTGNENEEERNPEEVLEEQVEARLRRKSIVATHSARNSASQSFLNKQRPLGDEDDEKLA